MTRTDTAAELDFHASGFIVKVQGLWTDDALHQFRHFLNLHLIFPSDDELLGALLADGRKDVHKALVIVGSETSSDEITAHAYTDGGIVRRYEVRNDQGVLCFADHPPGHAGQWKQARKILNPTREGFEERLEVDGGDGSFVPYYVVCMRRVGT